MEKERLNDENTRIASQIGQLEVKNLFAFRRNKNFMFRKLTMIRKTC